MIKYLKRKDVFTYYKFIDIENNDYFCFEKQKNDTGEAQDVTEDEYNFCKALFDKEYLKELNYGSYNAILWEKVEITIVDGEYKYKQLDQFFEIIGKKNEIIF